MIVVSNSSPLIALARIGHLNLLSSLFGCVLIPPEVRREVTMPGRPGAEAVSKADWIKITQLPPTDPELEKVCELLGAGERGAILLAKALAADLLLLDERRARRIARDAGIAIVGCLGLLEAGARRGVISDLRQAYADLLRNGIRFDLKLLQESLMRLGLPRL